MKSRDWTQTAPKKMMYAVWALMIAGCAADVVMPPSIDLMRNVSGTWVAPLVVPGSGEQWTLSISGASITGTGSWQGEACCSGTVAVSGSARGDSLHLDLVYTQTAPAVAPPPHRSEHIDGTLTSPTDLVGVLRLPDGTRTPAHFLKQNP